MLLKALTVEYAISKLHFNEQRYHLQLYWAYSICTLLLMPNYESIVVCIVKNWIAFIIIQTVLYFCIYYKSDSFCMTFTTWNQCRYLIHLFIFLGDIGHLWIAAFWNILTFVTTMLSPIFMCSLFWIWCVLVISSCSLFPVIYSGKTDFRFIWSLVVGSTGIGPQIFFGVVTLYGKEYHMGSSVDIFVLVDI